MNKKLAAKIQKLIPLVGESELVFSSSIAMEPPEKELILKKGSVYTVFDINSPVPLNVPLITKVINDVMYDSYYHSENISPIQSLEKAVVNINEKISSLAAEQAATKTAAGKKDGKLVFNIVACVLWGNVLYLVQYGQGKSYLMREGEVKEVSSTSEGNFSVASGVVKNGDVIVLCTDKFAQKYPPNRLLDSSLSSNDLEADNSSLILKFMVDEEFTQDEVIDFGVKPDKKAGKLPGIMKGLKDKKDSKQKDQTIASLVDDAPTPVVIQPKKDMPNIKVRAKREPKVKINTKALTIVVGLLLVVSISITLLIRNNRVPADDQSKNKPGSTLVLPKDLTKKDAQTDTSAEQPQPQEEPSPSDVRAKEDAASKTARVDAQPFYDIKLADEAAVPSDIVIFANTVVVTDKTSGKIFTSETASPKFVAQEQAFPGIRDALNYDGLLNFVDDAGYKTYNLADGTTKDSFTGEFGITARYLGNIYSIEGNKIIKYVPADGALTNSDWGTDDNLSNAKVMDVAYSIYVVTKDNNLLAYTQGENTGFTITGLDKPLSRVTDLEVDVNFDYIYLADAGNNRVVLLNDKGEFVKQIKASEETAWADIRSISVNSSESTLYVLSGSKVYEVDLAQATVASAPAEVPTEAPNLE